MEGVGGQRYFEWNRPFLSLTPPAAPDAPHAMREPHPRTSGWAAAVRASRRAPRHHPGQAGAV